MTPAALSTGDEYRLAVSIDPKIAKTETRGLSDASPSANSPANPLQPFLHAPRANSHHGFRSPRPIRTGIGRMKSNPRSAESSEENNCEHVASLGGIFAPASRNTPLSQPRIMSVHARAGLIPFRAAPCAAPPPRSPPRCASVGRTRKSRGAIRAVFLGSSPREGRGKASRAGHPRSPRRLDVGRFPPR